MMDCSRLVQLLADYLDGVLPADQREALERHLGGCPDCDAFLRTYRTTVALLRTLRDADLPQALRERLSGVKPR